MDSEFFRRIVILISHRTTWNEYRIFSCCVLNYTETKLCMSGLLSVSVGSSELLTVGELKVVIRFGVNEQQGK